MSTYNICFYGDHENYPLIITKYPPYLFYCLKFNVWREDHGQPVHIMTRPGVNYFEM